MKQFQALENRKHRMICPERRETNGCRMLPRGSLQPAGQGAESETEPQGLAELEIRVPGSWGGCNLQTQYE